MLELRDDHRRVTFDARTERAPLAYERQQRIVASSVAAHEVRHHILGHPRTIARQRARDRDRDIVGRRRRERSRGSLARPGPLPDSRRHEIHQLLRDRPRRRELGPDRRQQLRHALARVIDDRVRRRPVLRARCTVRQRLHPRVHEQHTLARDRSRRPRRRDLAKESLDVRLELRFGREHPLARVVRGADERAPSPWNDEEAAHSPLFARGDRERGLHGGTAREHEIERDPRHRRRASLASREPLRHRCGAGTRRVDDHRRAHVEALAALAAERVARRHAREHAAVAHRSHLLHVVRDRRARTHRILEHGVAGYDLSALREADTGTSATPPELVAAIREALPHTATRIFYGSTEAGPATILPHVDLAAKPGGVGRPQPGCEVRLSDTGEVCVRNPFLMDGYFDDADATADALRDGWYHTGDLGAFDADGYLSIVGRARDVIRSGGETISPVEIEQVLTAHPAFAEVAVVASSSFVTIENDTRTRSGFRSMVP